MVSYASYLLYPSKHDTSAQCLTNAGPPSTTLAHLWSNIGCHVSWDDAVSILVMIMWVWSLWSGQWPESPHHHLPTSSPVSRLLATVTAVNISVTMEMWEVGLGGGALNPQRPGCSAWRTGLQHGAAGVRRAGRTQWQRRTHTSPLMLGWCHWEA